MVIFEYVLQSLRDLNAEVAPATNFTLRAQYFDKHMKEGHISNDTGKALKGKKKGKDGNVEVVAVGDGIKTITWLTNYLRVKYAGKSLPYFREAPWA